MTSPPVVITGLGAITPLGTTSSDMWASLCAGSSGIGKITAFDPIGFDCKLAGQVPDFKVQKHIPKNLRKSVKLMSRDIELAVAAADQAIRDSSLVTKAINPDNINIEPTRMAINLGAGLISCDLVELAPAVAKSITHGRFDIRKWGAEGIELVPPLWLLKYLPNMLACHISIIHDIQGPSNTITCAEASAHLAIAEAAAIIARGSALYALAGAAEAKVNPIVMIRQCLLKRTIQDNDADPDTACRPFDAHAKGSVFGEAAGMLILENLENARKRNARIYAQLAGTGQSSSINPAYHHLEPDGKGIQIAIQKALEEAHISPEDLDLIIPHGTAVPADDLAEAKAIQAALGRHAGQIPLWPTKSMLSNTGAAAGALDVIAAVYAINDGKIPAAKNCDRPADGCNLNIVKKLQQKNIRYALCCSYTYGGQTTAIVLKNLNGETAN